MTYKEVEQKADAYLSAFPDASPKEIFINGFMDGFRTKSKMDGTEKINYATILERFNATCTAFSALKVMSDKRKDKVRARWLEMAKVGDPVEVCQTVFAKMQASPFLRGENKRGWHATFDWLFDNSNNWVKVYEGQYDSIVGESPREKDVNGYWDR